jgi:hypothetical protein
MGRERDRIVKELGIFKGRVAGILGIERMILFGSRAAGRPRKWSDIDLLIVGRKFSGKKFYKRSPILYNYWKLNYPVDFLCYTPEEFEKERKRISIVSEALREGIEI